MGNWGLRITRKGYQFGTRSGEARHWFGVRKGCAGAYIGRPYMQTVADVAALHHQGQLARAQLRVLICSSFRGFFPCGWCYCDSTRVLLNYTYTNAVLHTNTRTQAHSTRTSRLHVLGATSWVCLRPLTLHCAFQTASASVKLTYVCDAVINRSHNLHNLHNMHSSIDWSGLQYTPHNASGRRRGRMRVCI